VYTVISFHGASNSEPIFACDRRSYLFLSETNSFVHSGTDGRVCVNSVSSEISDFTQCAHAQSDILHTIYAEKTHD